MILPGPLKPCKPLAHRNTTGEAKSRPSLQRCETWVGLSSVTFAERNRRVNLPKMTQSGGSIPSLGARTQSVFRRSFKPKRPAYHSTAFKLENSTADMDNGWHTPVQLPCLAVHHPLAHCLVLPLKVQPDNTTPRDATGPRRLESTAPWDSWLVVLQKRNWSPDNRKGAMSGKLSSLGNVWVEARLPQPCKGPIPAYESCCGFHLCQHELCTTGTAQHISNECHEPTCCLLELFGLAFVHPRHQR